MKKAILTTSVMLLLLPFVATAFPFGGRASIVLRCVYNSTIYTNLGPPRGGEYIWTTATRTYQFGPPAYAGQWILGLAGAPYYCIYIISPLTIYTGIAITMMGSSGPAAPAAPLTRGPTPPTPSPGPSPTPPPTPAPGPTPTPGPTPIPPPGTLSNLVISEVYYAVDAAHGNKPTHEWLEIFNGTSAAVNVSGWKVEDALQSDVIPGNVILSPGRFLVVAATSTTRLLWSIPQEAQFVSLGSSIGDGLSNAGDRVVLRNASGVVVDAVSWGTNTTVMKPSVPVVPYSHSMARGSLSKDTNTASDWLDYAAPTPGK